MWIYIILGIIYIIIGIVMFFVFSAYDFFDEYASYKRMEFPYLTFVASLFWVISIPFMITAMILSSIFEWIEVWGYAIRESTIEKKRRKKGKGFKNND